MKFLDILVLILLIVHLITIITKWAAWEALLIRDLVLISIIIWIVIVQAKILAMELLHLGNQICRIIVMVNLELLIIITNQWRNKNSLKEQMKINFH